METTRQLKISRLIQKELAEYFRGTGVELGHGTLISVTVVRISPDLSVARVYLSIFPPAQRELILKGLEAQNKSIRFELGRKIARQVRHIPELKFFIDDSLDYAERIDQLLKQ
jgi:ribosome-binding factor A